MTATSKHKHLVTGAGRSEARHNRQAEKRTSLHTGMTVVAIHGSKKGTLGRLRKPVDRSRKRWVVDWSAGHATKYGSAHLRASRVSPLKAGDRVIAGSGPHAGESGRLQRMRSDGLRWVVAWDSGATTNCAKEQLQKLQGRRRRRHECGALARSRRQEPATPHEHSSSTADEAKSGPDDGPRKLVSSLMGSFRLGENKASRVVDERRRDVEREERKAKAKKFLAQQQRHDDTESTRSGHDFEPQKQERERERQTNRRERNASKKQRRARREAAARASEIEARIRAAQDALRQQVTALREMQEAAQRQRGAATTMDEKAATPKRQHSVSEGAKPVAGQRDESAAPSTQDFELDRNLSVLAHDEEKSCNNGSPGCFPAAKASVEKLDEQLPVALFVEEIRCRSRSSSSDESECKGEDTVMSDSSPTATPPPQRKRPPPPRPQRRRVSQGRESVLSVASAATEALTTASDEATTTAPPLPRSRQPRRGRSRPVSQGRESLSPTSHHVAQHDDVDTQTGSAPSVAAAAAAAAARVDAATRRTSCVRFGAGDVNVALHNLDMAMVQKQSRDHGAAAAHESTGPHTRPELKTYTTETKTFDGDLDDAGRDGADEACLTSAETPPPPPVQDVATDRKRGFFERVTRGLKRRMSLLSFYKGEQRPRPSRSDGDHHGVEHEEAPLTMEDDDNVEYEERPTRLSLVFIMAYFDATALADIIGRPVRIATGEILRIAKDVRSGFWQAAFPDGSALDAARLARAGQKGIVSAFSAVDGCVAVRFDGGAVVWFTPDAFEPAGGREEARGDAAAAAFDILDFGVGTVVRVATRTELEVARAAPDGPWSRAFRGSQHDEDRLGRAGRLGMVSKMDAADETVCVTFTDGNTVWFSPEDALCVFTRSNHM